MEKNIWGDLSDWGKVLDALQELKSKNLLDEHQTELAGLIRYRMNWRLMEEALSSALSIRQANDVLIAEALNTLVARDVWLDLRILSAKVLGHLLPRRVEQVTNSFDASRVLETMSDVAALPGPPVLKEAVSAAIEAARAKA